MGYDRAVTPQRRRAIGYIRVSTDKQADHGVSLDAQREKLKAMAQVQDLRLVDVIVDAGESAKSLKRPGLSELLNHVDRHAVDVVIVCKLDRITRSLVDLDVLLKRLERNDVALVSVAESLDTGSASGRLVLNLLTAVSQWEREAISERTKTALAHKKARGERISGKPPYGHRVATDGVRLEPDREEQRILALMLRCRQDGMSLRAIAAELNTRGLRTRAGSPWRFEYVRPLVRRYA